MDEQVKLEILLDKDVVEWVDSLKDQLGLRRKDSVVNRLLRELMDSGGGARVDLVEHAQE